MVHCLVLSAQGCAFGGFKNVTPCQISRRSLKPLLRYGHFFDFSRWRSPARHFRFVISVFGSPTKSIWWSVQNLVGIDAVVLIICMFFYFTSLAGERLFTPPKLGFWGI